MNEDRTNGKNDGLRGGCSALLRYAGRRDPRGAHPFFPEIPPRNWRVAAALCARVRPAKYGDGGEERVGNVFERVKGRDAGCGTDELLVSQSQPRVGGKKEKKPKQQPKPGKKKIVKPGEDIPWYEFWGKEEERWFAEEQEGTIRRACCGGLHFVEEPCFGSVVNW